MKRLRKSAQRRRDAIRRWRERISTEPDFDYSKPAGVYATTLGVLAGFSFGAVVLLIQVKVLAKGADPGVACHGGPDPVCADSASAFVIAFFGLLIGAMTMAMVTGEEKGSRAVSVVLFSGVAGATAASFAFWGVARLIPAFLEGEIDRGLMPVLFFFAAGAAASFSSAVVVDLRNHALGKDHNAVVTVLLLLLGATAAYGIARLIHPIGVGLKFSELLGAGVVFLASLVALAISLLAPSDFLLGKHQAWPLHLIANVPFLVISLLALELPS
jgi:hypothetical protein